MKNADLAILGLIVEKPRYGYEIEQVIEERNMREWTEIGFSSIYNVLNRLEKNGYLAARLEAAAGRGPARKVYKVTEEGRAAWYQATLDALSSPGQCEQSFFLGLVGLPAIPREAAIQALESYGQRLKERQEQTTTRWQEIGDGSFYVIDAMFEYSLKLIDAELEWIEDFKRRLATLDRKL